MIDFPFFLAHSCTYNEVQQIGMKQCWIELQLLYILIIIKCRIKRHTETRTIQTLYEISTTFVYDIFYSLFSFICETQSHRYDPTWPLIFCVILIHSHQRSKFYDRHIMIVRSFTRNGLDIFIGSILQRILEGPYLCMWSSFDQLYSCWGLLRGVCNRTHVLTRLMRNIII